MKSTTIKLEFLGGDVLEFETNMFMCAADRVAFERRFGVTVGQLAEITGSGPGGAVDLGRLREEWILFFAWRCANRSPGGDQGPFDAWIELVAGVELADIDPDGRAETAVDPTAPTPLTTS
jgi:hypothetical protein